jgi:acetyltransferase-like isoleucine patch superfamily enzyme
VIAVALATCLLDWLPATQWFTLRRRVANVLGVHAGDGTRLVGHIRKYGRSRVLIGDQCFVGNDSAWYAHGSAIIRVGSNCVIAPGVMFHNGTHHKGPSTRRAGAGVTMDIVVGDGCWLGARCTVLAGARIGAGTIVAAGATVIAGSYPDNVLLAGVPARPVRTLD